MAGWNGQRAALGAAVCLGVGALAACAEFGGVRDQAIDYNIATDEANNKQIFLNILRAGHVRGVEWTSLRLITGQRALTGSLSLAAPLGPRGSAPRLLTPLASDTGQSNSQIDVLDAREFYQNYIKEIDPGFIANFLHEEIDAWLYYVFIKRIDIDSSGQHIGVSNNPGSSSYRPPNERGQRDFRAGYNKFEKLVEAFFDANLVPEPYSKETPIGPPLKAADVKTNLRAVVTGITSEKAPVALGKSDEEVKASAKPKTRAKDAPIIPGPGEAQATSNKDAKAEDQYQLSKSKDDTRYCLRAQLGYKPLTLPVVDGRNPKTPLEKFALALRCGATAKQQGEKDKMTKVLKLEVPVDSPSLVLLDWEDCPTLSPSKSNNLDYVTRYCNLVEDVKMVAGISDKPPPKKGRLISIKILTRSTDEIVAWVGNMAAWYYDQPARPLWVPEYASVDDRVEGLRPGSDGVGGWQYCGAQWDQGRRAGPNTDPKKNTENRYTCYPLIVVNRGSPESGSLSAIYEGETYWIPRDPKQAGHTAEIFELIHELVAYDKVAKDLPAGNLVTVTPLP